MKRLLVVFLLLTGIPTGVRAQTKFERAGPLDPDGAFRLHTLGGYVKIIGWDRDSVLVRGAISAGLKPMAGGGRAGWKMSLYEGSVDAKAYAQLEVFVPRGAQVWIKGTSATVTATGLTGNVDLNTIEGRIELDGSPRELRVETMRGDVVVKGSPRWLRLKSGDGSIVFEGDAGDAVLTTVDGAITTTSRLGRGRVETVEGTVTISGPVPAGGVLDVDSHSGPVTLQLDQPVSAAFSVFTVSGRLVNSLGKSSPKKAPGTGTELAFIVGKGNARITVRTFSAPVSLLGR